MENMYQTHSTKMGAVNMFENTPNAQNLIAQIVCPSPKVWDFIKKRLHWESVVHGQHQMTLTSKVKKVSLYSNIDFYRSRLAKTKKTVGPKLLVHITYFF